MGVLCSSEKASLSNATHHSLGQTEVEVGDLPNLQHAVGGTLFLVGTKSLKIKNFRYDGLGPGVLLANRSVEGGTKHSLATYISFFI